MMQVMQARLVCCLTPDALKLGLLVDVHTYVADRRIDSSQTAEKGDAPLSIFRQASYGNLQSVCPGASEPACLFCVQSMQIIK